MRHILPILVVALVLSADPAVAGIANSPLPTLNGQTAVHVYSVPGVNRNGGVETIFQCTSTDRASISIGVQVFALLGTPVNDPSTGNGVLTLAPGETRTISTGGSAAGINTDLFISSPPADIRGSARILSTSKNVICTAFLLDKTSISIATLPVLSKLKQKGD